MILFELNSSRFNASMQRTETTQFQMDRDGFCPWVFNALGEGYTTFDDNQIDKFGTKLHTNDLSLCVSKYLHLVPTSSNRSL